MSKKILIVDDEPHMLRLTELSLKKMGCTIVTARSGLEAMEVATRELPALIVMDVTMPEMDGIAALRLLKAAPATASIPVIMLTNRGQSITRTEAEGSGAALYLTKPFSPSSLATEARRIIDLEPVQPASALVPNLPAP